MIFFTADLHLGHKNIIKLAERPFSSAEEMDETLIANWNKKVKGGDTVYIAGDLINKSSDPKKYLARLKGKKVLICGNHDAGWLELIDSREYFVGVEKLIEQSFCGHMVTLCHYPMIEWRASRKGISKKLGYLIHGHIHKNTDKPEYYQLFRIPNALNAGVDINNFEPVTFEELILNNSRYKHALLTGTPDDERLSELESALKLL